MADLRSVSLLGPAHTEGIRALSREPDFAAAAAMSVAMSPEEAARYIAIATEAREEGRSFIFVLTEETAVLGICRLIGVLGVPRLVVAIGGAHRGQGNGSLIVRHVLEFAFESLHLEQVTASGACLRLVAQFGELDGNGITRQEWRTAQAKSET